MNHQILRLAIPSIISNITVPLLGLVDVAITGHMGDARYMAAIAVGSMVFNIIYWLFSFLRFGTGGLTARAYGKLINKRAKALTEHDGQIDTLAERDFSGCCNVLLRALLTCLLLTLVLLSLQVPLFYAVMWIIAPGESLLPIVRTYYSICIWGTFPSLALYAFTGWFVGMQNTKLPMAVSISQNVVNILLSLLFVYGLHMKIEGVALGTLLAQWSGLLMAFMLLRWRYRAIWKGVKLRSAIQIKQMKRFFSVNGTLFFRTVFLVAVNLWFIVAGAKGGAEILSVNSVLMQMFILYTYVMDGFAYAAEALCGKYHGANDKHNFALALKGVWRWAWALTLLFTLAYSLGGETFLDILTNEESVRLAASPYLPWAILIPICGVAAFVWDGVFVGLTEAKAMLCSTFVGALGFFVLYFALYPYWHNHALWLAFNAYLLLRGLTEELIWRSKR
ncbi:MAG: MATE family efflux transporter [Prevotella sp.]|nr:MATE family efflux transporter [Prevotella sp.]